MKILVLPIGKIRSRPISEVAADYAKRLSHYVQSQVVPCRDEAEAMANLKPGDLFIVMDSQGKEKSSEDLAGFLSDHQMRGTKRLCFFVGGPDGIGKEVRGRADLAVSLSCMTFPHELAQVMLLEQLYRAFTILKGEPYHK